MRRPPRLVALTPGDLEPAGVPSLLRRVERALAAGLPGLLLRELELPDRAWLALLDELLPRCAAAGAWLGAHDRAHLVAAPGSDGAAAGAVGALHLGFRSLPPQVVRACLRPPVAPAADEEPRWVLGLSTHAPDPPGAWDGADYLFHGPVRPTPSKRGLLEAIGFEGLARGVHRAEVPLLAIGGLEPRDVASVRAAGAFGLAVRAPVLGVADPGPAVEAFLEAFEGEPLGAPREGTGGVA